MHCFAKVKHLPHVFTLEHYMSVLESTVIVRWRQKDIYFQKSKERHTLILSRLLQKFVLKLRLYQRICTGVLILEIRAQLFSWPLKSPYFTSHTFSTLIFKTLVWFHLFLHVFYTTTDWTCTHVSLQNILKPGRLNRDHLWTSVFKTYCIFLPLTHQCPIPLLL